MCDTEQERNDEDRADQQQAIDRENRGVFLCANCGHESVTATYCGDTPCGFYGCPECMTFDEAEHNYFCSPECVKRTAIRRMQMGLLKGGGVKENEALLRNTLSRLEEIKIAFP